MKANFNIAKNVRNSRSISALSALRKLQSLGLLLCALMIGSLQVWGADPVASQTPTNGNSYVIVYWNGTKYLALPNISTTASTYAGVEVTINGSGQVTTADAPEWTLAVNGSNSSQFYIYYTSGGSNYYLRKNGTTGKTNYNIQTTTSTSDRHYWTFTAGTGGSAGKYSVHSERGSKNTELYYYDNSKWEVSGTSTVYNIILLEKASSCSTVLTLTKSATSNGSFSLHQTTYNGTTIAADNASSGTVANCAEHTVYIVPNPNTGYKATACTATNTKNSAAPTADGSNWYAVYAAANAATSSTVNVTFSAKQAAITFDKNDGTGGTDGTTATYGTAMTTITAPTRYGYTFDGYYDGETDGNGSGTKYYNTDGTSARNWDKDTEAATTLYAKWIEKSVTNYRTLCCNELAAPTNPNETPSNDGGTLYWDAVVGATGYEVNIDGGGWASTGNGTTCNYTVTDKACGGTSVSWQVRATGDGTTNCAAGAPTTVRNFSTSSCSCTGTYSFHYQHSGAWNAENICFSPVAGATNNYLTDELSLPYAENYKVAWQGVDQSYTSSTGFNGDMPFFHNRDKKFGANPQSGNLGGGKGKFHVYHDSGSTNKYVSFIPTGYTLNFGTGDTWTNDSTKTFTGKTNAWDETEWYTDLITLKDGTIGKKIFVGLQTASGYVWCDPYSQKDNLTGLRTKTGADSWLDGGMSTSYAEKTGKFRIYANSGDKNWYVTFVPYYRLTYNANSGTGAPSASGYVSCEGNAAARTIAISATEPTRVGYRFMGWATSAERAAAGTVDYKYGTANDEVVLTESLTLFAVWKQLYTVTYDYDGGSGSCSGGSYIEGETVTVCASTPTKAGSDFAGWSYSPSVTVTAGTFPMPGSNVAITATWTDHTYTLTHAGTGTKTNTENKTTIKSSDTPLTLHYTCTGTNAFPLNDVSISGGGKASWTRNTNFTWEVGSDKQTATLVITPATIITADLTITINMKTRYTVIWDEHGITTTEYYASDDNTVTEKTEIDDCGEKKFYRWTEDGSFVSDDDTPPDPATFGTISGDKHYYAIYGNRTGGSGFVKVTSITAGSGYYMATGLTSSDYVYTGQNGANAYGACTQNNSTGSSFSGATLLAFPTAAKSLTVAISNGKFSLYDGTSYLGAESSNSLTFNNDPVYEWQLSTNKIQSSSYTSRYIKRNTQNGRVCAYSTTDNVADFYLYKPDITWSNFSKTCELYDITITTPSGGTVTTTPTAGTGVAGEGQEITVNVTPNSCKYLSALKYNDGSDHAISIASTPYTFTMPASDVTVTATFADKSVSSIAANTDTHRTLMQGTAFEGEQIRVTYNNGETEDLAWNDASLTFSGYNMSTLGDQTVSVAYSGSCGNANTSYSIEITDGIPVTFSDCGITTVRKYEPGDVVPVETTTGEYACSGWEFVGWSESSVAANSTSFTPVRNFNASTARTLYAVYANVGTDWISAFNTSELRGGATYVIVYRGYSYDYALLNTVASTNYLNGQQLATACSTITEPGSPSKDRYVLEVTPTAAMKWQLVPNGDYYSLYNAATNKYLKITTDQHALLTSSCEDKFTIANGYNDSQLSLKSFNASASNYYLYWYNSDKYFEGWTTAQGLFLLTNVETFSSNPPCAPRSVDFHGNGGQITEYGESPDEGDPVELTITEASRDAGIRLPSARFADCNGKSWTFVGWSNAEIDVTRIPVLTTDLLENGVAGAAHTITSDDEEYWAVFTNQGNPETKNGTISFNKDNFNKAYSSSENTTTKTVSTMGDYTFGYVYVGHQSEAGIQFQENTGELYNKTSLGKVNSISFTTFSSGDINKLNVYVGNEEKTTDHLLTAAEMQNVGSTWTYYPNDDESYVYITNIGKGNGSYVCVTGISIDFGKGTKVWATTPDCSILTLSGTVKVTSTNGKKVKAVTPITVTGKDLTPSTSITFAAYNVSDDTPNSNFTFIGSVSTNASGDISSTTVTVAYQPTVTTDGIEEVYFRATDGTTNSNKLTAYGRHLPAKFVIATKVGDDWYALPNNVTTASYGTRDIIPITVDNTTAPTTATVYTSTTDYLAWGMNAAGTSTDRYTTDGEKISFVSAINSKGLAGNASGLRNSAGLPATTSNDYLLFDWTPATTDLVSYTLQNGSVTTYYVATNGSDQWNTATTGADVRFLIIDEQPAPDITWYNDMLDAEHTSNKAENGYVTLPTGADPESCNEPSGLLTFDGWVTDTWTGFKTTGFTKVVGGEVATSNTTYYAVFKTGDNKYYTKCPNIYSITYTPNGGTGSNYVTYTMNTTADAVTVETAGFEKSGSTFVGWTNPSDEDGTIITPGAGKITGLSGNITLNAVWIGTVSVTGTVRLTAADGEKVATGATDVTISSTDLACATALRITYKDVTNDVTYGRSGTPSYTSSEFRLCNGSYGAADLSNISLAEVSGAYNQTFSMTYEPNGGANTLDEYQLKVEVLLKNTVIDTKTLSLYGRTLPASFAIAIKIGGSWYALPNNMGSSGTYDPILISVTEDASVLNWAAQGPSTVAYKMKDYTTNYSKLRFAADDATEYCLWAATGNAAGIRNYSASSTDANYAWTVAESNADFSGYTMANLANTRTALKINDSKWQMYSSGGLSEIHFIPLTTVTPIDVTVMEWGADEIAVKTVANWTPSAITAQISGGSPSAVTKTSIGGDLYKLTGVGDLQGNPGEPLALNVTDGGAKQAIIQIPFIVTDTKTEADLADLLVTAGYADTRANARNLTKNMDVIVRRNGTLSSSSSTYGTFQNVYIYPGGKADFSNNISIQNIYMRGGFSWLGGAYAHPQMNVASTASISGIGSTGHGIFYDLYLDNSIYYVFALPKDVAVTAITNEENGDDWDAWIKSYSGEGRTLSPKVSGWHYVTSGSIARGAGYEIAIKPRLNRPYGILRFPLLKSTKWSAETDCTPEVTGWGANNTNVSDNNKGWNFIGNPFLTAYNNAATPGSSPSGLIQTKTLVPTDTDPWDGKYQWATSNVKYFTVPRYTEYEYDDIRAYPYKLDAFFPFFIQVTGDGTVSFDDANKALKTPARYVGEPVREVFVDFQLINSNGQSDVAGLTISDQYSDEFDMNDKEKTIQNGNNSMKLYTLVGEYRTAFNALTEATAALPIPVGIIAPSAGTYRFAKLEDADYSEVEHLWLTDYLQSRYVDLLVEPFYEFTTEAGRFEDRFAINATLAPKQDTPTDIDGTSEEIDQPIKFIYHDKMYILRNGVLYDATGKRVREINK